MNFGSEVGVKSGCLNKQNPFKRKPPQRSLHRDPDRKSNYYQQNCCFEYCDLSVDQMHLLRQIPAPEPIVAPTGTALSCHAAFFIIDLVCFLSN